MYRIGDTLFTATGKPGVIVGRADGGTSLRIETQGEKVENVKQRGYINGLSPEEREVYNQIVDDVRASADIKARVEKLQEKVESLKLDPRQLNLTRYLEAELAHTMNTSGFQAREYIVPETQAL